MNRQRKQIAAVLLTVSAVVLIGCGFWIQAKAVVAQYLLRQAWEKSMESGKEVKAWPWADTWPVARLQVKRLGVDFIVLEGQSGEVLAFGPGRLTTAARPNEAGNCILAGHRDTSFRFLADIKTGDVITLQSRNGSVTVYRVVSTSVISADRLFLEKPTTPWLTLITCYPFTNSVPGGPLRFVAFAEKDKKDKTVREFQAAAPQCAMAGG